MKGRSTLAATSYALPPDRRTTAIADRPAGVASAAITSLSMYGKYDRVGRVVRQYFHLGHQLGAPAAHFFLAALRNRSFATIHCWGILARLLVA